jgi:UDP-glucose 4-epimerase
VSGGLWSRFRAGSSAADHSCQVAGRPVEAREAGRRPGDMAGAYTRIDRAERLLGWRPQYDVADGIRHSLQWAAIRDDILPAAG